MTIPANTGILWSGQHQISPAMQMVLIAHVGAPQPVNVTNFIRHKTVMALLARGWLRYSTPACKETVLSVDGRSAALFVMASEADRLVAEDAP